MAGEKNGRSQTIVNLARAGRRHGRHRRRRSPGATHWRSPAAALAVLCSLVLSLMTATVPAFAGTLVNAGWSASSTITGAQATYSYRFSIASNANLTEFTMGVPAGTTAVSSGLTVSAANIAMGGANNPVYDLTQDGIKATLNTSSNSVALTFTNANTYFTSPYIVTINIGGFVNTSQPGNYSSTIATYTGSPPSSSYTDVATTPPITFTATGLIAPSWSATSTVNGATGVSYTYRFRLPVTATLTQIVMTVPPGTTSTGTNPTIVTATPAAISGSGGSVALSTATSSIIYTLPNPVSLDNTSTITLTIGGLTNTALNSSYQSEIITYTRNSAGTSVPDSSVVTPPVAFTAMTFQSTTTWASTTTATSEPATYTWGFTIGNWGNNLTSITMTVPPGTTGTPALGIVSVYDVASQHYITLTNPVLALSGTTLTLSFSNQYQYFESKTTFSIGVNGLTTSSTSGTYASAIAVYNGLYVTASATTANTLALSSTSLGTPIWNVSSTVVNATNVTYEYSFTMSVSAAIAAVTMAVPAGTTGTPVVESVSPASMASGGSVTFSPDGSELVYSFPSQNIPPGTTVDIKIEGLTNTPNASTYFSTLTAEDAGTAILASAVTTSTTFTATSLTSLSWTSSSYSTGASNATYTYVFTTDSTVSTSPNGVTISVPIGTTLSSSPAVTIETTLDGQPQLTATSTTLSGTTLTITWADTGVSPGSTFTITVQGLTNTSTPGAYSASIAVIFNGTPLESGTTGPVTMMGGSLAGAAWSLDQATAGAGGRTYSYSMITASTATLSQITMTVPPGTTLGSPVTVASTDGIPNTGTVTLSSDSDTLTYSFTPGVPVAADTALTLQLTGITNTSTPGSYTSTITTWSQASGGGTSQVDQATTAPQTINPQSLTFTNSCTSPAVSCAVAADGSTSLTLFAIPGGAPATASVSLGVTTDAAFGYFIEATLPSLTSSSGATLTEGAPSLAAAPDAFYAGVTVTSTGSSGASACSPYNSATTPLAGYSATGAGLWFAETGAGTDTAVIANTIRASATLPAGTYTGTISYTVLPNYVDGPPTC